MKFITLITFLASAIAISSAALPVQPNIGFTFQEDQNQPQKIVESRNPVSAKSYIVVFKESAALQAIEKVEHEILNFGGKIGQRYTTVMKGFSAWIPAPVLVALSANPFIDYIEEDSDVGIY
ncbi:hypothetical protein BGX27_004673 [Mortierella sp. AM989]|nr:hypothetical protein BGX27_004673 [Mortierella sp. AM989]